jgi:two-component system sensor histidine kinase VanS
MPSQISQIASYSKDLLGASIDYWNGLIVLGKIKIDSGQTIQFHYTSPSNGTDNIVFAKPVINNNDISEFIFAISSLQPVCEAVDVMKNYYFYAFLVAIILIAAMALLFSKLISKPLIKMNQVAAQMANLDFSQEVPVKSTDELGSMAVSLNRLSKNLGTSLSELKVANEQLHLDIEKEKTLEVMRKEFVASVSHELKTPLGIIKGFAEGVKDNIAAHKKDYYIDVILDEIEKMDELVLDLLDLAKLESKAYKLDLESFNIIDLVNDVEARLTTRISEKRISFELEHEPAVSLRVYGDLRRMEQVITNILNNAIRHTEVEGHIRIGVKKLDTLVYVYIENSGNPIAEEEQELIWDRFYRAEKSRDRKSGGTGLGLSIVKNILEMHESQFGVENTQTGVSFYFSLQNA